MNMVPRWWHSRKGMVAVVVLGGYVAAMLMGKQFPTGFDELARIVVVALFLTANGEEKSGDHVLASKIVSAARDKHE